MTFYLKSSRAVLTMRKFDDVLSSFLKKEYMHVSQRQMEILTMFSISLIPELAAPVLKTGKELILYQIKPTYDASSAQFLLQDTAEDAKETNSTFFSEEERSTISHPLDPMSFYKKAEKLLNNKKLIIRSWRVPELEQVSKPDLYFSQKQNEEAYSYYLVSKYDNASYLRFKKVIEDFCTQNPLTTVSYKSLLSSRIWFITWRSLFPVRYNYIGKMIVGQRPAITNSIFWNNNDMKKHKIGVTAQFVEWIQAQEKLNYYEVVRIGGSDHYAQFLDDATEKNSKFYSKLPMSNFVKEFVLSAKKDGNHLGFTGYSGASKSQEMVVKTDGKEDRYVFGVLNNDSK